MSMCCLFGVCIPYSSLIPILMMLWRPIKQWFDQYFGNTPAVDTTKTKKTKKSSSIEQEKYANSCCGTNTSINTPDANPDSIISESSTLFQKGNSISLREGMSFEDIIASEHPTCVKFTAAWCKPCKQQEPEIIRLAETSASTGSPLRFVSVDVDEHDELFASLEIVGIPHIRLYRNSEVLESFTGRSIGDLEKACALLGKKVQ